MSSASFFLFSFASFYPSLGFVGLMTALSLFSLLEAAGCNYCQHFAKLVVSIVYGKISSLKY